MCDSGLTSRCELVAISMERNWRVFEPNEDQIEAACVAIRRKWDEQTEESRRTSQPSAWIFENKDFAWCRCGAFIGQFNREWVGTKRSGEMKVVFRDARGCLAIPTTECRNCTSGRDSSLLNLGCERQINNDWHEQKTCDQPPWWEQIANED